MKLKVKKIKWTKNNNQWTKKKNPMQANLGWPSTPKLKKDLTPAIIFLKKKKQATCYLFPLRW